jgi:ketosteroid isomerase-like protein
MFRNVTLLCAVLLPLCCAVADQAPQDKPAASADLHLRAGPAASATLSKEILAKDSEVFGAVFNTCDVEALRKLVTDDMEFFHDKDGLSETSGAHFVDDIARHCERIKQGVDFRARRELVESSVAVYPLNNYGAVETGVHNFYAVQEGKPDRMTESSQFLHIWKNDNGQWKLARVVSYNHKLAP